MVKVHLSKYFLWKKRFFLYLIRGFGRFEGCIGLVARGLCGVYHIVPIAGWTYVFLIFRYVFITFESIITAAKTGFV